MHPEVPGHYSEDMELGRWSRNNTRHSLSSSTVQRRAGVCSDFLAYLSSCCGLEEMDSASYYLKRSLSAVTDTSTALGSPRAVRRHPRDLRLPTLQELKAWLDHLREARGPVAYYMGKTAVEVGLRADEIIHLREDQLPPLPLDGQKQAKMPIRYGTKGLRKPQDPAKTGKERSVYIPTEFLVELHRFKDTTRKAMVHRLKNKSDDWKEPNELFFSEKTGKKYSYKRFYEIWKSVPLPFSEYSPHIARHAWACYTLIDKMGEDLKILVRNSNADHAAVDRLIANIVRIWISGQLGHVDEKTTDMYIQWVRETPALKAFTDNWWDYLNAPL